MTRIRQGLAKALVALIGLLAAALVQAEAPRGVAITPRNFPNHSAADVDQAFTLARELGEHAAFIYQWSEFDTSVASAMV